MSDRTRLGAYGRYSTDGPELAAQLVIDAENIGYPDVRMEYDETNETYVVSSSAPVPGDGGAK